MNRLIPIVFFVMLTLASCTKTAEIEINDPNETATAVMVYVHPYAEDSARFGISGKNIVIDWGDGTIDSIGNLTIQQNQVPINTVHYYEKSSKYVIKITAEDLSILQLNSIIQINLTRATKLKSLHIGGGILKELKLTNNILLENINCQAIEELANLDLSTNIHLKSLVIITGELKNLNIKNASKLINLDCSNNKLNELDLSGNPNLETISFYYNQLKYLDFSENPKLKFIHGSSNNLTEVDLSIQLNITGINLGWNNIAHLKLPPTSGLKTLIADKNKLTSIDNFSKQTEMEVLNISENMFTDLSFTNNLKLKEVDISSNLFPSNILNKLFSEIQPNSNPNTSRSIRINSNPGTGTCDPSIATNKGWTVRKN